MARPGWPERNRAVRSFRQLRRFHHVINSDKVFGTHSGCGPLPHCASSALPSPRHLLPTTLVFEAAHPHLATMEWISFLRLQPARRTLAALVFPSRVLSTSKVSRSPFLMLSGSMPADSSALMCKNTSGPPASSP